MKKSVLFAIASVFICALALVSCGGSSASGYPSKEVFSETFGNPPMRSTSAMWTVEKSGSDLVINLVSLTGKQIGSLKVGGYKYANVSGEVAEGDIIGLYERNKNVYFYKFKQNETWEDFRDWKKENKHLWGE